MSLVAEVLSSIKQRSGVEGGSVGGDGVCVEVAELAKRAGEAKVAVIQAFEGQYTELCSALQDTTVLQTRVTYNLEQLQQLQGLLETDVQSAVSDSVDAVISVAERWKQAVEGLEVAQQLLAVHEALKTAGESAVAGQYHTAAKSLNKVEKLLSTVDAKLEILPSIIEEVFLQRTSLIHALSQVWAQSFRWEEELNQQDNKKTLTLLIRCCQSARLDSSNMSVLRPECSADDRGNKVLQLARDFRQVLAALHMLGELAIRLRVLADNLLNNFFKVVLSRTAKVSLRECGDAYSLSVTISTATDRVNKRNKQPSPVEVFSNLEELLRCLHETGCGLEFESGQDPEEKTTLMRMLGQEIGTSFTKLLISECLAAAVPSTRKNLSEFDLVKVSTEEFHAMLLKIGFYCGSESSILEYAANVDAVFSNKACAQLLDTARDLITQPLHNTVTIAPQDGYPPLAVQDQDQNGVRLEQSTLRLEKLMAAKTFHMPKCQVSKSICELLELLYNTMEEACTSSAQYAGRLLCTVRNMLALYDHVTPVAHAHTLGTIPQHAALVHNNSMFIATHCYLLSHQYKNRLPAELREAGPCVVSFTDLSYQITKTGTEVFCKAMQSHKKALLDTIGQAQGFGEGPSDTGARQCLRQLQQLCHVWCEVLPHSVYNKAMGTLLNSVVKELIERIVSLEDISQDSAVSLIATLAVFKDNAASLFPDAPSAGNTTNPAGTREGLCGVRQWGRYQELMVVLGASLRELQDRWADGKGPLALYFTPDQAKSLVRALFQNTDRRAQLLARIKLQ
uniref:Centromere/kinetochore protein zw10 homolog n=2 Tax=Hirondellea gigas TaxID=1518452 RepID=A0A6A7FN19_9CRUS